MKKMKLRIESYRFDRATLKANRRQDDMRIKNAPARWTNWMK